jgi:protein TonB
VARSNLRLVESSGPRLPAAHAPPLPSAVAADRVPPPAIIEPRFGFAHVVAVSLILHGALLVGASDQFLFGDERSAGGTEETIVIEGVSVQLLDGLPSLPAPPMAEEITSADEPPPVEEMPPAGMLRDSAASPLPPVALPEIGETERSDEPPPEAAVPPPRLEGGRKADRTTTLAAAGPVPESASDTADTVEDANAETVDDAARVENADPDILTADAGEPALPEEPDKAADVPPDAAASSAAEVVAELDPQPAVPSLDDTGEEAAKLSPPALALAAEDAVKPIDEDAAPVEPVDRTAEASASEAKPIPYTAAAAVEVAEKPAAPTPAKPKKPPARKSAKAASPSAASTGAVGARGPTAAKTGAGGKAKSASGTASVASYQARVRAQLTRHRSYPPEAARRRLSGTATVSFTINAGGRVVAARLVRSSGQGVLDRAALAMVRRASPFPPIPPGMGGQITVQAPIRFAPR